MGDFMIYIKKLFSVLLITLLIIPAASAHPGPTDADGGHYDEETGEYHFHEIEQESSSSQSTASISENKPALATILSHGQYYVRVTRVIDGNTVEAAFNETQVERVRLIGINTPPETVHTQNAVQYYGKETTEYTKAMLTDKKVWLFLDVKLRDEHQHLLGYIWMEKPKDGEDPQEIRSKMFNAILLLEGYGQVMIMQPNSQYEDIFGNIQAEAREYNRGIWNK